MPVQRSKVVGSIGQYRLNLNGVAKLSKKDEAEIRQFLMTIACHEIDEGVVPDILLGSLAFQTRKGKILSFYVFCLSAPLDGTRVMSADALSSFEHACHVYRRESRRVEPFFRRSILKTVESEIVDGRFLLGYTAWSVDTRPLLN